jgi:hypothetical protein
MKSASSLLRPPSLRRNGLALARLMGHTTTRTLERYVSNTFEHYRKAVSTLADRIDAMVENGASEDEKRQEVATEVATGGKWETTFRRDPLKWMVERRRFELPTPTLRTLCSTN